MSRDTFFLFDGRFVKVDFNPVEVLSVVEQLFIQICLISNEVVRLPCDPLQLRVLVIKLMLVVKEVLTCVDVTLVALAFHGVSLHVGHVVSSLDDWLVFVVLLPQMLELFSDRLKLFDSSEL